MEAVDILIQQGKVLAAGVSNYSTDEVKRAIGVIPVASNQVAYSMVNRGIEEELIPYCLENKVGILAYSPLQRGILTGKFTPNHKFAPGDSRPDTYFYKKKNIERINDFLDELRPLADGKNASLAQVVLRWTLQRPAVTSVLAGIRNEKQLKENAGTLSFTLSDEEMDYINTRLAKLEIITE
jgi:aryl-alcohol dehydrogenase-like predicted oxidoreductase